MRSRRSILILSGLLLVAGAWFFWPRTSQRMAEPNSATEKNSPAASAVATAVPAGPSPKISAATNSTAAKTNSFSWRLANTQKSIGELVDDPHAILLENALIDTRAKLDFSIPKNLRSPDAPRAYIVQARGRVDDAFRAQLAGAGARIVSYIPNNAYLVEVSADGAQAMAFDGFPVIPFEPYYKMPSSLLAPILKNPDQPLALAELNVAAYPGTADETAAALETAGLQIVAQETSPFGRVFTVQNVGDVAALARLAVVQRVEPFHRRIGANDLSRAITGVAANSIVATNYLNLTGTNVWVQVNDLGVDATHPDLAGRVFGAAADLLDTDGHGTHVAGIIAGSGLMSPTVTNAAGSIMPAVAGQFRGKAPAAELFSMNRNNPDIDLQQAAVLTNTPISNNSWAFADDYTYDLGAASYDAATRDSLPGATGSQPVLYVFSAGNNGGGEDDGVGGGSDTILSPATAKNVISVGAIEQLRDITNYVTAADGSSNADFYPQTDTSFQVAGFSSRGNVGIGTEGTLGRFKPDVVAPGTFVISTRSQKMDLGNYYYQNPTNDDTQEYDNIVVDPGQIWANSFPTIPDGAVGVSVQVQANADSPTPFPNLPIYMGLESSVNGYDYVNSVTNIFSIPPDGPPGGLADVISNQMFVGFNYAISNTTTEPISFDVITHIITTNGSGNSLVVLSNVNNTLGPWYRYESGTSMAAADVSGVLALMEDYFTNTLKTTPSPALLKALLINGSRQVGNYNFNEADARNYQGWGLINLPNSVRPGMTGAAAAAGTNSIFFIDQSPTNALATGDRHTFLVNIVNTNSGVPLRVTLAWTDPPGNPAAAIKLVNNLDLVVTNLASGTNSATTNVVYYGNDIPAGSVFTEATGTNGVPNLDSINNVENVYLSPPLAATYAITVFARDVNVNAVTAHTNNVVQDFALVISGGAELVPASVTVTDQGVVSNSTSDQQITVVTTTNTPLANQFAGANSPLLGTNTISGPTASGFATNALITIGMTNQWHFYVVTNTTSFTNAAFVTFSPDTLSIPRMGVFADSDANSTRPEADIDLYVASEGALTNLDPNVISNCVNGLNGDAASLGRGGTEFVTFSNSTPNQVYYIGVKSEDQMAAEYSFLPVFTATPFSQLDANGDEIVNGVPLPTPIPDGSPAHPGVGYVFGFALQPMEIDSVTVSNEITHQNFGDLIGTLSHDDVDDVLNNHDSLFNDAGVYGTNYDDSQYPESNSQRSDGPGSLNSFVGQQASGVWILTEVDDSLTQTGAVTAFSLTIKPHTPLTSGSTNDVPAMGWYYSYVDVPIGATNLTIAVTNFSLPPGVLQLFVKLGAEPTTNDFDFTTIIPAAGVPAPNGSISIGLTNNPPLQPGRYYVGIYNPNSFDQSSVYVIATIGLSLTGPTWLDFDSSNPLPLLDDAVMSNSISVPNTDPIAAINVGIRVDHQRISDLVFHLISPDGSRYLLMENRGAYTTNGAGVSYYTTNTIPVNHTGNDLANTNIIDTGETQGTITLDYDVFELPDTIDVYYNGVDIYTNYPAYVFPYPDISGTTNISFGPGPSTDVTVIINAGNNTNFPSTAWKYAVTSTQAKYAYLTFTEDTNLTTTPIKFAPPPFIPAPSTPTNLFADSFETNAPGVYTNGQTFGGFENIWTVTTNSITIVSNSANADVGTNYVSLGSGSISTVLPTVIGQPYVLQYSYSGADLTFVGGVLESSVAASTNGWQTHYVYFTAAQSGTPITVQGTGTNALLDNVILTELPPSLYYLPEQSIASLIGKSPTGTWWMEVQDDRAGAGLTNSLVSWQLSMVLANTNALVLPVFTNAPGNTNMNELTTLVITNSATDANTANLPLTYSLINPPSWATIDPNTGIVTLSPLEADGPGTYIITTLVTDGSTPPLSAEDSFTVTVNEVNTPPFWPPNVPSQTNYTIRALNLLTVTNTATDSDIPSNTWTYMLTGQPAGMTINTNTGIITWSPTVAQVTNVPYLVTTIVTDTNVYALTNRSLSATNFFNVTVLPPLTPTNGVPVTNTAPAGSITWYLINVPTNAIFATNSLLFATGPLDIWFSTNLPPTITNPNDFDLIPGATNGTSILSTVSSPTNIVPGGVYYLGVQNPNSFSVNYAIEVTFDLAGPPVFLLQTPGTNTVNELTLLTVTNTASDLDPATTLGYKLTMVVDTNAMLTNGWTNSFANTTNTMPVISPNGIITWTPSEAQGPGVYDLTTIVTNTETPSLSATNFFVVVVNESNTPPVFLYPTNTTLTNIVEGFPLNLPAVVTDSDLPTNQLTFALVSATNPIGQAIINLTVNPTNGLINWAPTGTNFLGTNLVSVSVTDYSPYAPTNQHLSVTNSFKIVVWERNTAPFWLANPPTNIIAVLTTLVVTNTATDTDIPPNTLTYRLLTPPTPAGVLIDTNTGIITWTPSAAFANTTNTITTVVTDFNPYALTNQHLSATNSFVVIVLVPPYSATLAATAVTGASAILNGFATPNGSPAFAWFEWGTNSNYGNQTRSVNVGNGKNVVFVTNLLNGLLSPTPAYHFRLDVSNGVAVAYGFDQILDVGGAVAWGDSGAGQTNVPAILTNTAVAVAGGLESSLALRNNGLPVAWGDNTYNQTNIPASVTNAVAVAAGGYFNLALRNTGRVVAWGNGFGFGETNVPATLSNVVAIAAGGYHSLALRTNGTVVAWGNDVDGQTNVPPGLSNVVAVAGGLFHSLALKNDGTVVAWGDPTAGDTNVPPGLNTVVAIAAGHSYSLALQTNGTVVAWGNNAEGETNVPAGLNNVVAIAAGGFHCLALRNDGTVVAWGNDSFNQTNVPAGLNNMAAVAGGGYHSLALVAATPVNPLNNHPPFFLIPNPTNHTINVSVTLTVTNTAKDTDIPAQTLTYSVSGSLGGTNFPAIITNGIITWTPVPAQAGQTNVITTIVTDNGLPPMSATNSVTVILNPIPFISSVTVTTNGFFQLNWFAPSNDYFLVESTTNLAPPVAWLTNSGSFITSPTTNFLFIDTNLVNRMKFYRLLVFP